MSSLESLNYYDRLEVSKKASLEMIKLSYRNLSKRFHPDRNQEPDAEQNYLLIQEAYETLSDDQKRKSYDQTISSDDFWSSVEGMPNDLNQWDFPEESQSTKERKWSVPSFYLDWSWDWYDVVGAIWWLICLPFWLVVWIAIGIYWLFQFILGLAALALMLFIAVPIIIYVFWFCVHSVFPNIM